MRTDLMNCIRKRAKRNVSLFLLIVFLAFLMTGCVPAPKSSIPIADITVANGHLIVQNETGFVWFDAKITIDDKYAYKADVMPAGKSSLPLAEFIDDRGHGYEPGLLSIRNITIDVTDTVGGKRHFRW